MQSFSKRGQVNGFGATHKFARTPKPSKRSRGRVVRRFRLRFLNKRDDHNNSGAKPLFNPTHDMLLTFQFLGSRPAVYSRFSPFYYDMLALYCSRNALIKQQFERYIKPTVRSMLAEIDFFTQLTNRFTLQRAINSPRVLFTRMDEINDRASPSHEMPLETATIPQMITTDKEPT